MEVSTEEPSPTTVSSAPPERWFRIHVCGQALYSAPNGHSASSGSPPRQSTPSPSLVSSPMTPSALYFAASCVVPLQSSGTLQVSVVPRQTPSVSPWGTSHCCATMTVASPLRWLPLRGAPEASTSMHFNSPVKFSTTGGTRPGSNPAFGQLVLSRVQPSSSG